MGEQLRFPAHCERGVTTDTEATAPTSASTMMEGCA
ncbi:hypothetical protein SAMN05192576_0814 [Nocardioides szechwanensis]|uniref:Uncharacterized protein n=1 Tax=Nocardioides szechwanensis TaxID=1005944 RepID=A0A1G9VNF9_9ACTN|nr:hypothetical protein SAMN05192576_0814 [Nocardioides szechwanensis]